MRPDQRNQVRPSWAWKWGVAVAILSWGLSPLGRAQERLFRGPEPVRLPAPAADLATADLDGDGRLDVVARLERGGAVILLAAPGGGFAAPIRLLGGADPAFLGVGDFGGSALPDLFVLRTFPATAQVLLNQGGGEFVAGAAIHPGGFFDRAAIGDVTGDGISDVVVSESFGRGFAVLVSDGTGGLEPAGATEHEAIDVAITDIDADGHKDVVALGGGDFSSVTIFPGRSDGVFDFGVGVFFHTLIRHPPRALVTGQFNADDRIDIAVSTTGAELVVLDNIANFSFAGRLVADGSDATPGAIRPGLLSADLDRDGVDDLLIKDSFLGVAGVRAYLGEGTGRFTSHRDLPVEPAFPAIALADLNGDGLADVVGASPEAYLSFYRGAGVAELEAQENLSVAGFRPIGVAAIQVDAEPGEATGALVVLSPSRLHVFPRVAEGFQDPEQHRLPGLAQRMALGSFTAPAGAGGTEVALTDLASRKVYIISFASVNRRGEEIRTVERDVSLPPDDVEAGDLDGDGVTDLVLLHRLRDELTVLPAPGKPDAPPAVTVPVAGRATAVALIHANDDARVDLLVATETTGLVYLGDGLGGFAARPEGRELPEIAGSELLRVADGDADGAIDIVLARGSRVVVLRSPLSAAPPPARSFDIGVEIHGVAVGAGVPGEHAAIVLVSRSSGISTLLRGAFHPLGPWVEEYAVTSGSVAAAFGELSGEGREDLAIADFNGGKVAILAGVDTAALETFRRGDANLDGTINIGDPLFILNHLFAGNVVLLCADAADVDDDGTRNIADPIGLLNHLFAGGVAPAAPGPAACGVDPTADDLPRCEAICR